MRTIAVLALLGVATVGSRQADARSPAPAAHCLDARQMQEARQASPQTLAIALNDGTKFRVDLAQSCPDAVNGGQASLLAREGWVCGLSPEFVEAGGQRCAVAAVTPIDARTYAQLARAGARDDQGVNTLDAVQVHAEKQHGFTASASYCLNPRWMRSWTEDGKGLIVEMSPKRAGGNRFYRVELSSACPDLAESQQIELRSGMGIGVVCGNAGDQVVAINDAPFERGRQITSRASRFACPIAAVYPIDGEG